MPPAADEDLRAISIEQKARHCKVERRLKTASAFREVDIHPSIACLLKEYIGQRKAGFLFSTRNGKLVSPTNIDYAQKHWSALADDFRTFLFVGGLAAVPVEGV